jgi:hypothetical protein
MLINFTAGTRKTRLNMGRQTDLSASSGRASASTLTQMNGKRPSLEGGLHRLNNSKRLSQRNTGEEKSATEMHTPGRAKLRRRRRCPGLPLPLHPQTGLKYDEAMDMEALKEPSIDERPSEESPKGREVIRFELVCPDWTLHCPSAKSVLGNFIREPKPL